MNRIVISVVKQSLSGLLSIKDGPVDHRHYRHHELYECFGLTESGQAFPLPFRANTALIAKSSGVKRI
jgi:hypothetical protein